MKLMDEWASKVLTHYEAYKDFIGRYLLMKRRNQLIILGLSVKDVIR